MKKFFLFATAAVALTVGCQKDEITNVDPLDNGELVPVTFGTSVSASASVSTKAALESLDNQDLVVFGVVQGGDLTTKDAYLLGDKTKGEVVSTETGVSQYKTDKYYGNGNYDFYGYYDGKGKANPATLTQTPNSIVVPVKITGQEDLLLAKTDKVKDAVAAQNNTVDYARIYSAHSARRGVIPTLVFEHQLTQFTFKLENGSELPDGVNLYIKSLSVTSKNEGELVIDNAKDTCYLEVTGTTTEDLRYPATGNVATFAFDASEDKKVQELDETIMVMPDETSYTLNLGLAQDQSDTVIYSNLEIKLKDESKFLRGHSYEITVTVYSQERVKLNVDLTEWKEGGKITLDPDADAALTTNQLYATVDSQTATSITYAVNVPEEGYKAVQAAVTLKPTDTPADTDWQDLSNTKASSTKYATFTGLEEGKIYYCHLRYKETDDATEYEVVNNVATTPTFTISKSYFVDSYEASYNQLPAAYRTKYGDWATYQANAKKDAPNKLPWLAVEFTPSKEIVVSVEKDGIAIIEGVRFTPTAAATLLTLAKEEMGNHEITDGTYKVTVNGSVTEIEVELFKIEKSYLVKEEEASYNQLPESYREKYGDWATYLANAANGAPNPLPWLAVEFTPSKEIVVSVKKDSTAIIEDVRFTPTAAVTLLTLAKEEMNGHEITPGEYTVEVNGKSTVITVD